MNLTSASGNSRQVGLAQVFENGNRRAVIVAGQGLQPGAYALWLYNSGSDSKLLGFVPERVGKDGRFATQGELPTERREVQAARRDEGERHEQHQEGADQARRDRPPGRPEARVARAGPEDRPLSQAGSSFPGFMIPAGSSSRLTARSAARPSGPSSASIHGRWSRPIAW